MKRPDAPGPLPPSRPIRSWAGFESSIRRCEKCGARVADDEELRVRYCGPGQRFLELGRHPMQVFLSCDDGHEEGFECRVPGEHFHWQCPRCRY